MSDRPTRPSAARKPANPKVPATEKVTPVDKQKWFVRGAYSFGGLLLGVALTFSYYTFIAPQLGGASVLESSQTTGQVALTEPQLRDLVVKSGVTVYWAGPQENCLYSLEINANRQAFVRYLPNGKGIGDTLPNYEVIGTYPQSDAFNVTRAAGGQANSISFVNADGAQVYYSKSLAKNVYLAYPNIPYEIEVYNPISGAALSTVTASGKIEKVQ